MIFGLEMQILCYHGLHEQWWQWQLAQGVKGIFYSASTKLLRQCFENCVIPHRVHLLTRSRVKSTHSPSLRSRSHRVGLCTLLKLHQLPSNLSPYIRFLDLSRAGIRQVFCSRPVSITSFFFTFVWFQNFQVLCKKSVLHIYIYELCSWTIAKLYFLLELKLQ